MVGCLLLVMVIQQVEAETQLVMVGLVMAMGREEVAWAVMVVEETLEGEVEEAQVGMARVPLVVWVEEAQEVVEAMVVVAVVKEVVRVAGAEMAG